MPVSSDKYYKPEEALQDLQVQETILNVAIDVQVLLRILVDIVPGARTKVHATISDQI